MHDGRPMGGSGGSGVQLAQRRHYGVHRICSGHLSHNHEWVAGHHVLRWGAEPDVFGHGWYIKQQRVSVSNYRRRERGIRRHWSRHDCANIQLSLPLSSMGTITGGVWNGTAIARAYGGLNSTSAGTGLLRDGTTPAASEISGDCTT